MPNTIQEKIFDFTKPVEKALEKTSRYNYKKLLFLSISFSIFTSLGISLTSHVYEHLEQKKIQAQKQQLEKKQMEHAIKSQELLIQEKEHLAQQIEQEKMIALEKKQIQAITPKEFQKFQNYLSQNLNIYDPQIALIQKSIADVNNIVVNNLYSQHFQEYLNNILSIIWR
jgi:uncharacterized protein YlxW (UPF0749 family)